jgi:hypothetical protein
MKATLESPKAVAANALGAEAQPMVFGLFLRASDRKRKGDPGAAYDHWYAVLDALGGETNEQREGRAAHEAEIQCARIGCENAQKGAKKPKARKASSPKPSKAGASRPFTIVSLYPDPAAATPKAPKKVSRRIPPGKKAPTAPRNEKQEMREFLGLDKSKGAHGSSAKVWAWLEQHALAHDATLYSSAEWAKRGESVGRNSLFTIASEGPLYQLVNGMNDSPPARRTLSAFNMMLKKLGLYYEQGHAWTLHFYPRA